MVEPSPVGVSPDGSWANAEKAADFFEVELRIEQPFDELLASFFEVASVIVRSDSVIVERCEEHDAPREVRPDFLKLRVHRVGNHVV